MPELDFQLETSLPPEKLMGAMLDFSERRPDLWPGLDRKFYEVREVGEVSAHVKEGSSGPPFSVWALEHYDWATPWKVRWTVEESNFCTPGSHVELTVTPSDGGSTAAIHWEREPSNLRGRIAIAAVTKSDGKMLKALIRKGFDHLSGIDDLPGYSPPAS